MDSLSDKALKQDQEGILSDMETALTQAVDRIIAKLEKLWESSTQSKNRRNYKIGLKPNLTRPPAIPGSKSFP